MWRGPFELGTLTPADEAATQPDAVHEFDCPIVNHHCAGDGGRAVGVERPQRACEVTKLVEADEAANQALATVGRAADVDHALAGRVNGGSLGSPSGSASGGFRES